MNAPLEFYKNLQRKRERSEQEKISVNDLIISESKEGIFPHNIEKTFNYNTLKNLSSQIQAIENIDINLHEFEEDTNNFSSTFDVEFVEIVETYLKSHKKNNRLFKKKFIKVIRNLGMNKFEFSAFTLLLDLKKEEFDNLDFNDLYFIGLQALNNTSLDKEKNLVEKIDKKIPNFKLTYDTWKAQYGNLVCEINTKEFLTVAKIINRKSELKEANTKYDFIEGSCDYNGMVKRIYELEEEKKLKQSKKAKKKHKISHIKALTGKEKQKETDKSKERVNELVDLVKFDQEEGSGINFNNGINPFDLNFDYENFDPSFFADLHQFQ